MSNPATGMSMRAVTRLTGISEHLLRAWERRYRVVEPDRTDGGTRRYSDLDVARLHRIKQAIDAGHKIGEIASLSDREVAKLIHSRDAARPAIDDLLGWVTRGDTFGLRRELQKLCDWLGPERWVCEVASPLAVEIGHAWREGRVSIAQEHMTSECCAQVVDFQLMQLAEEIDDDAPRFLFATPPEEQHSLGIRLAGLVAASRGAAVQSLGIQVPSDELVRFAIDSRTRFAVVGIVKLDAVKAQAYLRSVRDALPSRIKLLAGGAASQGLDLPNGILVMPDLARFGDFVSSRV